MTEADRQEGEVARGFKVQGRFGSTPMWPAEEDDPLLACVVRQLRRLSLVQFALAWYRIQDSRQVGPACALVREDGIAMRHKSRRCPNVIVPFLDGKKSSP